MSIDNSSQILVCSPPVVTGGPELLHQLVHELRALGYAAYIVYYPLEERHERPDAFKCYNAPQASLVDAPDVLVVLPEVATWIARRLKKSKVAIWWLSLDNYFGWRGESKIRDLIVQISGYIRPRNFGARRIPIFKQKKFMHFFQSHYAKVFLQKKGISGEMLTDYLNELYLDGWQSIDIGSKQNIVCYNPKKGIKRTKKLISAYPDLDFVPIQGLDRKGVYDLLCRSKIYIDFGNHPGKDRLPREAAMARCCVITGIHGSASNNIDVPVPEKFKLDDTTDTYISRFGQIARDIFSNFEAYDQKMDAYRKKIIAEKELFQRQVKEIF